jgi:prepilin-type processing-associated H-X9-DG protein
MEPRDLHITQMATTINPKAGQGISSLHPHGAMAAYVDGHIEKLPENLSPEQLRARLTIAGGEKVVEE